MFHTLLNYIKINRAELEEIKEYFSRCSDEVDRRNLFMLRRVCMYTSLIYLGMIILAYFIVPGFSLNLGHIAIISVLMVYMMVNVYTRKRVNIIGIKARVICLTFYALMCFLLICIDLSYDTRPALWFPLAIMAFPVIYIDRQYKYGLQVTIAVLFYLAVCYKIKEYPRFIQDLYTIIAADVISLIISRIILDVRSKEGLALVEIRKFSKVDKLTNVLNKGALISEIDGYFNHQKDNVPCAMCIFDVDDFKQVNDGIGHGGGDALLEHVGNLLLKSFRPTDIIGRFGGDEFVVFMPNMKEISLVEFRCKSLQMMLDDFMIDDKGPFTLSIGAIVDKGSHSRDEVFRMADDALYKSKIAGKNKCSAWVVDKDKKFTKPLMVFVTSLDEENALVLFSEESDRFDILSCDDNDEAIGYISQYHNRIKLIVAEVSGEGLTGGLAIKYVKEREIFRSIPVLAVVRNEDTVSLAREYGADKVLTTDAPNETFALTIKELSGV